MTRQETYRMSLYTAVQLLHRTEHVLVEKVVSSLDGREYVRKTYPADKREIFSLLAGLDDPHIPKIADIFFEADTVVIEEYIPGKTLEQLIEENHSFSAAEIRSVTKGLFDAIEVLHSHGMIHRDIKPSNIMVRHDGQAVLIDYSIARIFTRGEDTRLLGTVGYAAPEQYGFSKSDPRTDLYALGVTMQQIMTKKNAPYRLRKAMARCTEFDPSRRFRDVRHLKKQLRLGRWLWWTGAVLVAALLTGAVLLLRPAQAQKPQHTQQSAEPALLYEPVQERIIDTDMMQQQVPCLMLEENGVYETDVTPADGVQPVHMKVTRDDDVCTMTIDGKEILTFGADDSFSALSYPDGQIWADIIFYDLNGDGRLDIIPAVSNAVRVEWMDGSVVLMRNYSLAWCVYYDGTGYCAAEGRMETVLDSLCLMEAVPHAIFGDNLSYYELKDGKLELTQ